ncbi:helix-turn-helix domain-containing protein [Enterococcus ureasiticus]|uniref:Mga helix-turn-helix domain-containing protein n=1 Tax=Enterococcus ureasiticus TaxID=903984 RepID=A0A1E5GAJ5_9ENTE|nr:helix-turn-helix domain-containing protein [Enterococcus ureasiticus]OEG09728.1 hypothetical protein BCR21_15425 [Enterococcus ureasiticus]
MRVFLDETYDRKLKVLSYIDNKENVVSVKEISESIDLSEKTVLQIIRQFEQEFSFSSEQFQIFYANKTIKGIFAENLDLMTIASGYLKESILYKIIYNIFLYEKVDVKKFCEQEYMSPSTFSRYRQKLALLLKKFDLKLSRNNKIYGDELKIRNFFFLFFSQVSNEWVFKMEEYREIEAYIFKYVKKWSLLNEVKQRKICLLIFMSNIRSSRKHNCDTGVLMQLAKESDFEYKEVLLDYFRSRKNRSLDQVWQELSFIQFFMYKEDIVTEKIQYDQYLSYFNEDNFSFISASNILTGKVIDTFFPNAINDSSRLFLRVRQEIDKMHLVLSTCYINIDVFKYVYDSENFYYKDEAELKINEQIKTIIDELLLSTEYKLLWLEMKKNTNKTKFIEYIYLVVYMLLNEIQEYTYPSVKVMVQNSKIFEETIIINKISLMFSDQIKLVSDFRDKPDILLTDVPLPETTVDTKVVYVNSFSDFCDFKKAVNGVKKEVFKKYNKRTVVPKLIKI